MFILGLTGNIGCGKSSVTDIFIKYNIDVVDADIISRKIFEDKKLLNEVFDCFGREIENEDGTLNRKSLGDIVFKDNEKLLKLNSLTHPKIKDRINNEIDLIKNDNKSIVVIDAALLVEGGYLDIVDKLIVVTCKEDIQIDRIIKRDNCSKKDAISRIHSQMSQCEKVKYGDYIIDNSGTLSDLQKSTEEFIIYMKENWCE
ncbi:MAG: dephospho-CoA kinase [Romboutsia sp.]|uniref:dephospho-CoA kinase n=1 Tax=Romboutsia sp. TaxID=1965302 RepID=UPI003F35A959